MHAQSPLPESPIDSLQVIRRRSGLPKTLRSLKNGKLTIGFLGGSITADYGQNWPDPVVSWFLKSFPTVRITVENAAVGATGSDSGCLRAQREIINRGCGLAFVEYAVNDGDVTAEYRTRSREGLIRKLLASGIEVVLVYTFSQAMYADMMAGKVPASIAELEKIGEYYGLSSVWMGLHALRELRQGQMRWDEWLPDSLHPQNKGSLIYAQAVSEFLSGELLFANADAASLNPELPEPLSKENWQDLEVLPLTEARTAGPWILKRGDNIHLDQILETQTPGALLSFEFEGRGLVMIFQYGKVSSEFLYRVDGGEWTEVRRERHDWAGDRGRTPVFFIADELPQGLHQFELKVIHGNRPDCRGCEFRLGIIGVLTGKK